MFGWCNDLTLLLIEMRMGRTKLDCWSNGWCPCRVLCWAGADKDLKLLATCPLSWQSLSPEQSCRLDGTNCCEKSSALLLECYQDNFLTFIIIQNVIHLIRLTLGLTLATRIRQLVVTACNELGVGCEVWTGARGQGGGGTVVVLQVVPS